MYKQMMYVTSGESEETGLLVAQDGTETVSRKAVVSRTKGQV